MKPRFLTQRSFRRLLDLRGACTCWCHAPCQACTDILTCTEVQILQDTLELMHEPSIFESDGGVMVELINGPNCHQSEPH